MKKFISFILSITLFLSFSLVNSNTAKANGLDVLPQINVLDDNSIEISNNFYNSTIKQINKGRYDNVYEYEMIENGVKTKFVVDSNNDEYYINNNKYSKDVFNEITKEQHDRINQTTNKKQLTISNLDIVSISKGYDKEIVDLEKVLLDKAIEKENLGLESHDHEGISLRCTLPGCTGSITPPSSGYSSSYLEVVVMQLVEC